MRYPSLGMIARWRPVHLGHAAVLRGMARATDRLLIGIGSSNRYDAKNPFTAAETRAMIGLVLGDAPHVRVIDVPDLGDGPRWRALVLREFGPLSAFATDNGYVKYLLEDDYPIVHPSIFVALEDRVALDATTVRRAMARGEDWAALVPPEVAAYLQAEGRVQRAVREFGAEMAAT